MTPTSPQDLYRTCKDMHVRMVQLLEQVEEEGLVCQLLDLIDKLNNTFLRSGIVLSFFNFIYILLQLLSWFLIIRCFQLALFYMFHVYTVNGRF